MEELSCLVYEVSVDTVRELLDEGVNYKLQVGAGAGFLILLFCKYRHDKPLAAACASPKPWCRAQKEACEFNI